MVLVPLALASGNQSVIYSVQSIKDLTNVIIPHFLKYPLLSQKRADFELFKSIVELMVHKEHQTLVGLHKILSIKASMNKGLTDGSSRFARGQHSPQ